MKYWEVVSGLGTPPHNETWGPLAICPQGSPFIQRCPRKSAFLPSCLAVTLLVFWWLRLLLMLRVPVVWFCTRQEVIWALHMGNKRRQYWNTNWDMSICCFPVRVCCYTSQAHLSSCVLFRPLLGCLAICIIKCEHGGGFGAGLPLPSTTSSKNSQFAGELGGDFTHFDVAPDLELRINAEILFHGHRVCDNVILVKLYLSPFFQLSFQVRHNWQKDELFHFCILNLFPKSLQGDGVGGGRGWEEYDF